MAANSFPEGIRIEFIGDSGPFSRTGKSIGYRVSVGGSSFLLDLGGPVFQHVGRDGIADMKGVFATHSHEDHRRWFTDLALYMFYTPQVKNRLRLITTEVIHEEWEKNSKGALERSLSADQKHVVEVPYDSLVEKVLMGPRARFHIIPLQLTGEEAAYVWRVVDDNNEIVSPQQAKVVVHPKANRPRLLFRDPLTSEWVEPETYYPLHDGRFYGEQQNDYVDNEAGVTVRPMKSQAWHGPPTYGMEFVTANERVLFTSDTVYDPALWHALTHERHPQKLSTSRREFEQAYCIIDDINNYIERKWSVERLEHALSLYEEGIVVHDVDYDGSVVHTSYSALAQSSFRNLLLTHSPDDFVSELPLARERKTFRIAKNQIFEEVGERVYAYEADLYMKRFSRFFVGFKNKKGKHALVHDGVRMQIRLPGDDEPGGTELGRYDLYADIDGRYYPVLEDAASRYVRRMDGRVECVTETEQGSCGRIVDDMRVQILRKRKKRCGPSGCR